MPAPVPIHRHPPSPPAITGRKVELQLFTTLRCNLRCTYCSEAVGEVRGSSGHVTYSMEALDRFIRTHLEGLEVYVTFYGGEPTLNVPFMAAVMERYPHFRYQLQTNGTLLHRLPDDVCAALANVLVSVDGGRDTTDGYRGRGVYNRVMRNLAAMRSRIGGSLTARVTWGNADTTIEEFEGLLAHFDYLYFQFAHRAGTYASADLEKKKRVLSAMVERFFASSALYPVIPLMGITRNKAHPHLAASETAGMSHCRVSTNILNVLPDGAIYPCPDMVWEPGMRQGDVVANRLARSPLQPHPAMPCERCEALGWCRRNCMKNLHLAYVQGDAAWRRDVVEPICELVKFLGREIDAHEPARWLAYAEPVVRHEVTDCPVYEYVEVMP